MTRERWYGGYKNTLGELADRRADELAELRRKECRQIFIMQIIFYGLGFCTGSIFTSIFAYVG